jgi:hypothetical protein
MKNQIELSIIAMILYLIYSNQSILEYLNTLFQGFLIDDTENGIKQMALHTVLFGISFLIIILILKINTKCYNVDNNNYDKEDRDCY